MRAVLCREFAPVAALRVEAVDEPTVGPGSVLIDVCAAGVNYPDVLMVQGKYQTRPPLPFVPGSEVAGTVRAVGEAVAGLAAGDRVVAFCGTGGFADRVAVPATQVFALPDTADLRVAAGMLITYGTAYHALKDRAALRPGETLLVLGAAGGVGLAAVELGALIGARVIAAASTADKCALARAHGAAETIIYGEEDLRERVKALTGGRGVDVVLDPVGGAATLASVKALAWGGRLLVVGFASGDISAIPANLLLLKNAAALGVLWGNHLRADPGHHAGNVADLVGWLAAGRIRPAIDAVFPLERVVDALDHLDARRARGKVILDVAAGAEAS